MTTVLEKAEEHDAAGRHQEALAALALAVRNGDAEGMTRLGKRLLIGDRAPHLPADAASLLIDAGKKGSAEAAAIISVLQALGLYMPRDLRAALASLVLSAQRGWVPAQGQLLALAGKSDGPDTLGLNPNWTGLAAGIDLQDWLRAPAARVLHKDPLVCVFPGFASAAVCRWLIGRSRNRLQRAQVYDAITKAVYANSTRTNSAVSFNLVDTDLVTVLVQARMAACISLPFNQFEAATVLHYAIGQQIKEHYDFVDPNVPDHDAQIRAAGQRVITFLVYLNDDYGGGETQFPKLQLSHKGTTGEGIFFVNALPDGRADVRTLHAGRPPVSGEKWIVSQFIRDRRVF